MHCGKHNHVCPTVDEANVARKTPFYRMETYEIQLNIHNDVHQSEVYERVREPERIQYVRGPGSY